MEIEGIWWRNVLEGMGRPRRLAPSFLYPLLYPAESPEGKALGGEKGG
jgi:hypothetical protein